MENTVTCTQCGVEVRAKSGRLCWQHWLELLHRYETLLASEEQVAHDDLVALFTEYGTTQAAVAKKLKAVKDVLAS